MSAGSVLRELASIDPDWMERSCPPGLLRRLIAEAREAIGPEPEPEPAEIQALERCLRRARSGDIAKVLRYLHKSAAVVAALRHDPPR